MDGKLAVELIFLTSSLVTIYLILRRRYLYIRLGMRKIKIDTYFLGALLGPILIVLFGILNSSQILGGLEGAGSLNPFGILVLFLSMVFMSIFLDITGFFEYCARVALKYASGDGRRLYFSVYLAVSFLTIFTSNDIIILTFTPFIYYFSKNAGIDPKPYLIAEFFAANTWSMMLYIGNPTNIFLAAAFHLRFDEYSRWMLLPSLIAGVLNMTLLYLIFRKSINKPLKYVETINPREAITDNTSTILGLFILGTCIVCLAIAPYFGIDIWIISLGFGLALLVILLLRDSFVAVAKERINKKHFTVGPTLKKMPISIIPFILSLFIMVEALRIYGITKEIGIFFNNLCGASTTATTFVYGISSAFVANVLNNIPMTVAYVPITAGASQTNLLPAVLATTIGSNLGANITPIGALAGIMWMSILRDKEVKLGFKEFVKYGLLVTPLTLLACLGILAVEFNFF
ncbi:Arsenical pump membrane protein [uncultured archaeon]|nr:Arsenical pump membrane protein [uncultured archaeon]